MKSTFRLSVLVLLLVLAVLPGALRGSGPAVAGAKGQLIVFDWSPFDNKDYYEDFAKKHPGVADVRIKADDADIYDAVANRKEPADIIHPYTTWLKRWVDEGRVQEIKVENLSNWDKVPESLKALGRCGLPSDNQPSNQSGRNSRGELLCAPALKGKQFFVPWDVGFSSIVYLKTDEVGPVESWKALFDERYKGHIFMFDDGPSAVEVYSYAYPDERREYDEGKITTEQFAEKNRVAWKKQKELLLDYWSGDDEQKLVDAMASASGNVWVAYAWPSAYAALKDALKDKGVEVEYAEPKEGRISWVGVYGILKDAKDYDLALEFLDEKLSTRTAENVVEYGYAVANEEVWRGNPNATLKELSLDDPSVLKRTNFPPELTAKQQKAWTEMWSRVRPN